MNVYINGKRFDALENQTILDVAKVNGIKIPTLCFLKECHNTGKCGICRIEVAGNENLVGACGTLVEPEMRIRTNSKRVQEAVHDRVVELINHHNFQCGKCVRKGTCEFLSLVRLTRSKMTPDTIRKRNENRQEYAERFRKAYDDRSASIVRDESKCLSCGRCVAACHTKSGTDTIQLEGEKNNQRVVTADLKCLDDTGCLLCGQCVTACPVGALLEKSHIERVKSALADPNLHVIVGIAPSVRAAAGEAFGMGYGTDVTGKLYTALRMLGFKKVFDVNFAADMTILEEGTELIKRIKNGGPFPMYTSCCPAWIRLVEHYYPRLMAHISSAKSPQQMFGAVSKSYYADMEQIPAKQVFTVTVMPCTAKKFEADRNGMINVDGIRDVDAVLDTRELVRLIQEAGICFPQVRDSQVDPDMGYYTGAAALFGVTGGVMEAALRTAKDLIEHTSLEDVEYTDVRGLETIKEAVIPIGGQEYRVAVIHGAANLFRFMERDLLQTNQYHFVEVMACPGGCVNGGGQPILSDAKREEVDIREVRGEVLYEQDRKLPYRKSHKNPCLLKMYDDYIGKIGGEKAHMLLHVHY